MSNSLTFPVNGRLIRLYAQEDVGKGGESHPAIILLHGSGGNLDFWTSRFGPALLEAGVALYAPHYFDRTGTARADLATISDGVHVPQWIETIDEAVHFVAGRPGVDPDRIVLAGISLGAFLTLAFAAQLSASGSSADHARLRALVAVSGGLVAPYNAQATRHFPPTLIIHGAQDTIVPVSYAEALDVALTELEVAHRTEILAGEGHWFSPGALSRMLLAISNFLQVHLAVTTAERAM